ncbi:MAG TPA: erythromycin esterase family protein [Longimicrobium sp.]|jgi:erythromycin esterase-like protein
MLDRQWRTVLGWGSLLVALAGCADLPTVAGPAPEPVTPALLDAVRASARPLTGAAADYDPLLALAGGARFVLLGESTHGTHEFYAERARISRRLFDEGAFTALAIEGDFHSADRVHRYVLGESADARAEQALSGFDRFPLWMWRNAEFRDFVEHIRERNASAAPERRVGVYGLDLQAPFASLQPVLAYLDRVDPAAAGRARSRYRCFDAYADEVVYARAGFTSLAESCADEAAAVRDELEARYAAASAASPAALDSLFSAAQHARVVASGEAYYRAQGGTAYTTWNIRDRHMAETLDRIAAHLARLGRPAKVVVWAHNTHVGDDRATEMGSQGEVNLGRLVREAHPGQSVLVGFTTYAGTVTAAHGWGGSGEPRTLNPELPGSFGDVFHQALGGSSLVLLRGTPAADPLSAERLERAVGVVYAPASERASHYFRASLARQFDAVIHAEASRAVSPLGDG